MLLALEEAGSPSQSLAVLQNMKDIVSRELFHSPGMVEEGFSVEEPGSWTRNNVFPIFLFLYHERVVILYYRRYQRALAALQKADIDHLPGNPRECVPDPASNDTQSSKRHCNLRQCRANILASADHIIDMLHKLLVHDLLRYAPSHV